MQPSQRQTFGYRYDLQDSGTLHARPHRVEFRKGAQLGAVCSLHSLWLFSAHPERLRQRQRQAVLRLRTVNVEPSRWQRLQPSADTLERLVNGPEIPWRQ